VTSFDHKTGCQNCRSAFIGFSYRKTAIFISSTDDSRMSSEVIEKTIRVLIRATGAFARSRE
jgi:hypothetical protein